MKNEKIKKTPYRVRSENLPNDSKKYSLLKSMEDQGEYMLIDKALVQIYKLILLLNIEIMVEAIIVRNSLMVVYDLTETFFYELLYPGILW